MLLYYLQKKEWYRGLISDILISDIKSLRYQDLRKLLKLLRVLSFCFWVLGNIKWNITVECLTGKRMLYSKRPLCNLCFILLVILVWIFLFCLPKKKKTSYSIGPCWLRHGVPTHVITRLVLLKNKPLDISMA